MSNCRDKINFAICLGEFLGFLTILESKYSLVIEKTDLVRLATYKEDIDHLWQRAVDMSKERV